MEAFAHSGWQTANQRHLASALRRISQALERYATRMDSNSSAVSTDTAETDSTLTPESSGNSPIEFLCSAFGLSAFERDLLLLCASLELDADCAALIARIHGEKSGVAAPTFALALSALSDAHWAALMPSAPLRYWRLIEVGKGQSLVSSPLRIDERILHFFTGLQYRDERLAFILEAATGPVNLVLSHREIAERMAAVWLSADENQISFPILQLRGDDAAAQRDIAVLACELVGSNLSVLHARDLPAGAQELELLQRLWEREAILIPGALMIVSDSTDEGDMPSERSIGTFAERAVSPLILSGARRRPMAERMMLTFEVAKPTAVEQLAIWRETMGDEASAVADKKLSELVFQFDLKAAAIRAATTDASGRLAMDRDARPAADRLGKALWESCRNQARPRLEDVVQRIQPSATWADLVLPERQVEMLHTIVVQVQQRATVYGEWGFSHKGERGLGIAALFSGPSGTGKTMAAEVLSAELHLDLYRIDLSAVVNKYIGETEKNLRRVFDAAEAGGAILLFDEADALFGKRSDVKDSHDRYANIEVSYLLQRVEAYRGLAILTTNLKDSVDQAFLRRLRFIVQFSFPDAAVRAQIWERVFPVQTPREGLDFSRLAQMNIAGGSIRNIALSAAFLAAEEDTAVSMAHVREAARAEYAKTEKTLTEAETRGWE